MVDSKKISTENKKKTLENNLKIICYEFFFMKTKTKIKKHKNY